MTPELPAAQIRVLVTGSRGKSSVVRLLHAAFTAMGLDTRSRVTGALPCDMSNHGDCRIQRSTAPHVEEMRWWLRQLPGSVEAIVMENSAIAPEFQALGARWLKPGLTVLTNVLEDHQEAWGPTRANAAEALAHGVPGGGRVVAPGTLARDSALLAPFARRNCVFDFAVPVSQAKEPHRAINIGLAHKAIEVLGLDTNRSLQAMLDLAPDPFDFRVIRHGQVELATAFAANDVTSTRRLFDTLGWEPRETRLLYNHRSDRPARWRSFFGWLSEMPWREVIIVGDRPWRRPAASRYVRARSLDQLLGAFDGDARLFGCGNLAGLPLTLVRRTD